jgi:tRNA-dihydrouridine synthase A
MLMDSALVFNTDINRLEDYLGFDKIIEPPVALQLGGNNPETLGRAVEIVERYGGYHEINLNCGCPSNKAKKVGFGAELMLEHDLVRQLVSTMKRRASSCDITVKCRIGTNRNESWEQLLSFVRACRDGGIRKMVIHARICMLSGLSPAQNRTIPPLRYDVVHKLVAAFPDMRFILNGGLQSYEDIDNHINSTSCDVGRLRDVFRTGSLNYLSRLADDNNYTPIYSSSRQAMPYEDIIQDSTASCRFNDIPLFRDESRSRLV